MTKIRAVEGKIGTLLEKEEIMWHQWSRIEWFQVRDRNIYFFHLKASNRKRRNHIDRIKNIGKEWKYKGPEITDEFNGYFRNIFFAVESLNMSNILNQIDFCITDQILKKL